MRHIAVAALLATALITPKPAQATSIPPNQPPQPPPATARTELPTATIQAELPTATARTELPTATTRAELLASWTQPTAASTAAWNAARIDQDRWSAYAFDWSTDLCSRAPEAPFGFVFADACRHHDFGYRNYRSDSAFATHKQRIDEVFREDLRRICDGYRTAAQPICNAVAWTYYQTVRLLGTA